MRTMGMAAATLLLAAVATAQETGWTPLRLDEKETGFRELYAFKARSPAAELYRFAAEDVRAMLAEAPDETAGRPGVLAWLPVPGGALQRFRFVVAPVFAERHAVRRAFVGRGVDDPSGVARVSLGATGLTALVRTGDGAVVIDPVSNEAENVLAALPRTVRRAAAFRCREIAKRDPPPPRVPPGHGAKLRVYRIAVACTSDYVAKHGGSDPLDEVHAVLTLVNAIYEEELAIRLELVPDNSKIVFTDPATDPFKDAESVGEELDLAQEAIDTAIGNASYDIGHVLSAHDGGYAYLGVLGDADYKAGGVTGRSNLSRDQFAIDYVAHEIGHQLGASHTFNGIHGACGGDDAYSPGTAYEPGSGTTIMGYAGICHDDHGDDNVEDRTDVYFHWASQGQIAAVVANARPHREFGLGNQPPEVTAPGDRAIPARTPFRLGVARSSDGNNDTLFFTWEQADRGSQASLGTSDDGKIPLFRSRPPRPDRVRYFPELSDVVAGNLAQLDEQLPARKRTMRFVVTARDKRVGVGGVAADEVVLEVVDTGKPFAVTAPAAGSEHRGQIQVRWDVAKTDQGKIGCKRVNIRLSCDGGTTFGTVLSADTANDGEQVCVLPDVRCDRACVMVEAAGNYFFAVSSADLKIRRAGTTVFVGPRALGDSERAWSLLMRALPVQRVLAVGTENDVRHVAGAAAALGLELTRLDRLAAAPPAITRLGAGQLVLLVTPEPVAPVDGGRSWEPAPPGRIRVYAPGGGVHAVYRVDGTRVILERRG